MKCKKILTALLAAACTMSGCHGDLDIMQDNKLSAMVRYDEPPPATRYIHSA